MGAAPPAGYRPGVRGPLLLALLLACGLAGEGCAVQEELKRLEHAVDVLEDTLAEPAPVASRTPVPVDLVVVGFGGDARHVLAAVVDGLERAGALELRRMAYEGDQAAFGRRRRRDGPPSPVALRLTCRFEGTGSLQNWPIAFPGMFAFLPVWLGYRFDAAIEVEAHVVALGRARAPVAQRVDVALRERNARRSALFHVWPLTGFYGTQFLIGLALAPTMPFYDAEETTPALVAALEPRLGRCLAGPIVAEVLRAAPPEAVEAFLAAEALAAPVPADGAPRAADR